MAGKLDVPMWGIVGDDGLNELAAIIAELRSEIKIIEKEILKSESNIDALNQRLNTYVKTILSIEDYDNAKDLLIINEKNEACIYPHTTLDEDLDLKNLPETDNQYKITAKQSQKIIDQMNSDGDLVFEYEDLLDEYDELVLGHDELWDEIHNSLASTNFFQVHDSKIEKESEVEFFSKKKHTLFVVKEENETWSFKYIRKKDEKKFYKHIDETQTGEEL